VVQSFDLGTLSWTTLPNLPTNCQGPTFIRDGQDLYLVNPYNSNVMVFNETASAFSVVNGLTAGNYSGNFGVTVTGAPDGAFVSC
jgi:hypothetical protein